MHDSVSKRNIAFATKFVQEANLGAGIGITLVEKDMLGKDTVTFGRNDICGTDWRMYFYFPGNSTFEIWYTRQVTAQQKPQLLELVADVRELTSIHGWRYQEINASYSHYGLRVVAIIPRRKFSGAARLFGDMDADITKCLEAT